MRALLVDNVLLERTAAGFKVELQPHLGLISLIATLRAFGHDARLYDPKVALTRGELRLGSTLYARAAEAILAHDPDIVGFTSLGCSFISTVKIAAAVRRTRPDIPIVLGGPHASIVDREIFERYDLFDVIVRGEAESTIGRLLEALGAALPLDTIEGLTFRRRGDIVRTRDAGPILNLDALPMSAYDAFPIDDLKLRSLDVDAGRGCPFGCAFCSTASFFGRRYRIKSARRLVAELDLLAARYGIATFNLTHDLFTVNKTSVREFCAAAGGRNFAWTCSARMDCVDAELLQTMRDAGCSAVYYGVETGSPRLQRVVDKRLDLALYHPTVRSTLALGMGATVSFITGFPAETPADRDATLELIGQTLDEHAAELTIQLHLLSPEPGTALHAQHAGSLTYDGHVGDFNVPLLASDDAATIISDPAVFACHHYYADGGKRAEDIAVTDAFRALYRLGHAFLAALARRHGGSFSDVLRDFAGVRERATDDDAAVLAFVVQRWGADDPYADIVRYAVAAGRLGEDVGKFAAAAIPPAHIRLTRRVVPIGACRDGRELLGRLRRGERLDDTGLPRSPHLLISAPGDLGSRSMLAIDETTFKLATALSVPATRQRLADEFGAREVERRLWVLESLGALVQSAQADEAFAASLRP